MYQVIARKYRPQTFAGVVSQAHVKRTLANAIDQRRIAHGYIFSGPRGTGKTTMARILAMALNCQDGPKSDFDPDDPLCREIAAGAAIDVIEIDAASNRRIDDIRELRENVRYRPARDRYKVFIIDEAHQITSDAFNALLKTLEEPPEWAVFILCTTEPQAIPATIHSRCQSFQFQAVELDDVVAHLRWICEQEGVEADDDALVAVALAGDGSIRDSLSTLDQAIASRGRTLAADAVRDLLGAIPAEVTERILAALEASDAAAMLEIVDQLFREGRQPQHFVGELCRQFRNLLVMKVAGGDTRLVVAGSEERRRAARAIAAFSQEDLTRYVQLLLDLYRDLQTASQPRFHMELGMLRLVYAGRLRSIEEFLAESGGGRPDVEPASPAAALEEPAPTRSAASPPPSAGAFRAPRQTAPKATKPKTAAPPATPAGLQAGLAAALREAGEDFCAEAIEHGAVVEEGGRVVIRPREHDRTTIELGLAAVEAAVRRLKPEARAALGADLDEAETAVAADASSPDREPGSPLETEAAKRALADPDVAAFQRRFEGQVREVRNLREYS